MQPASKVGGMDGGGGEEPSEEMERGVHMWPRGCWGGEWGSISWRGSLARGNAISGATRG